jgi:rRNA maturation endonuclease Nob1
LMRQLDAGVSYRQQIELEVAKRIGTGGAAGSASTQDPLYAAVCAACTTPNESDARFCKSCGAKLEAAS